MLPPGDCYTKFNDKEPMPPSIHRRKFLKHCLISGSVVMAAGYPFFIERYIFLTNAYTIPVRNLPEAFHGFTIAHLTDIHYGSLMPISVVRRVVDKTNALKTDVIVNTGDNIHRRNSAKQVNAVWPELDKLHAKHGVYSVLGNHDHWGDFERSMHWMKKTGQNLRHKAVSIEKGGERIWIGGAGDIWEDRLGIDRAFEKTPPGDCKIVLAHNPDAADRKFKTRIDLMISGHTHGGQVKPPFFEPPILPVENKRYSSGFIRSKNTNLFISRGIGWAIIPVRFNCFPEIAVLTLVRDTEFDDSMIR